MEDWEERLIVEEMELHKKAIRLTRFIVGSEFHVLSEEAQKLLVAQVAAMDELLVILQERIKLL